MRGKCCIFEIELELRFEEWKKLNLERERENDIELAVVAHLHRILPSFYNFSRSKQASWVPMTRMSLMKISLRRTCLSFATL